MGNRLCLFLWQGADWQRAVCRRNFCYCSLCRRPPSLHKLYFRLYFALKPKFFRQGPPLKQTALAVCQRVDKVGTLSRWRKTPRIFCEIVFVGVQRYGRERFRKKQVMARKTRCFLCHFFSFSHTDSRGRLSLQIYFLTFSFAVDQVFRQSDRPLWRFVLLPVNN